MASGTSIACLSVSEVLGSGWEPGYKESYRGREIKLRQPKVRLELAVQDVHADAAVKAIMRAESTDDSRCAAEGGIFVLDLNDAVRMRNGEAVPQACGG